MAGSAADRTLLEAVEELLRYEAPSPIQGRWVPATWTCTAGSSRGARRCSLLNGSADRDERHFPDADRFDVARRTDRNLAFGYGAHFCLGAALARLEGRVVLDETLDRLPAWEVDENAIEFVGPRPCGAPPRFGRLCLRSPPMTTWLGQYCINVTDLDASVAFYDRARPRLHEPHRDPPGVRGHRRATRRAARSCSSPSRRTTNGPLDLGTALWKLYVNTRDVAATFTPQGDPRAGGVGARAARPVAGHHGLRAGPAHDGYLVELVERHPWPDGTPERRAWLGQYCLNVTDIEATLAFYELLGLTCTSRTDIPGAQGGDRREPGAAASCSSPSSSTRTSPLRMGSMWKLYVYTDDCAGLHQARRRRRRTPSLVAPMRLDRWPVTIAFVADPDGYQVELVQRHETSTRPHDHREEPNHVIRFRLYPASEGTFDHDYYRDNHVPLACRRGASTAPRSTRA